MGVQHKRLQEQVDKLRAELAETKSHLATALEAWAWMANNNAPTMVAPELKADKWRVLGRDADGYLKYYYADTPFGAVLAAMEGERDSEAN